MDPIGYAGCNTFFGDTISAFPQETLVGILDLLSVEDQKNTAQVSKLWKKLTCRISTYFEMKAIQLISMNSKLRIFDETIFPENWIKQIKMGSAISRTEAIKKYIEAPGTWTKTPSRPVLFQCLSQHTHYHEEIARQVELFLFLEANPNNPSVRGNRCFPSAVFMTLEGGHYNAAKLLIEAGADISKKDPQGKTALEKPYYGLSKEESAELKALADLNKAFAK